MSFCVTFCFDGGRALASGLVLAAERAFSPAFSLDLAAGRGFAAGFFTASRARAVDLATTFAFDADFFRPATFFALAAFLSLAMSQSPPKIFAEKKCEIIP
ncbi:MAG: hypothetical protein A3F74_25000 [Betaproteobacteria bacterium RIFCSPLOWO2_12_FULL_62_58]|nr:MAG: hypothetical protein A3F74_25000 [Betaproteobacteria bacterium RIFCSPLOWO2_12_FULL_62_58]